MYIHVYIYIRKLFGLTDHFLFCSKLTQVTPVRMARIPKGQMQTPLKSLYDII